MNATTTGSKQGQPDRQCQTLALCNQKGGVGKTTTEFHLARAAVLGGLRILCIDIDPQANLTSILAKERPAGDQVGIADVLSPRVNEEIRDVIVETIWPNVALVPTAGEALAAVRDELIIAGPGRESRLRTAVADVADDYDLILIDCPPSLDQLTINGLTAADKAVIIAQAGLFSADGLAALLNTINGVQQYYNADLEVAGIILNQFEERTTSGRYWADELAAAAGARSLHLFDPPVPKRTAIQNSSEAAQGLDQWGGDAAGLIDIYKNYLTKMMKNGALS